MNNSKMENRDFKLINWNSIVIGIIITLIGFSIAYFGHYLRFFINWSYDIDLLFLVIVILMPIVEGFIVAYMNKPIYEAGIKNSTLATLIGYILFNLFLLSIGVFKGNFDISFIKNRLSLFITVLCLVFLGSIIGTYLRKT